MEKGDGEGGLTAEAAAAIGDGRCAEGGKRVRLVRLSEGEVRP